MMVTHREIGQPLLIDRRVVTTADPCRTEPGRMDHPPGLWCGRRVPPMNQRPAKQAVSGRAVAGTAVKDQPWERSPGCERPGW